MYYIGSIKSLAALAQYNYGVTSFKPALPLQLITATSKPFSFSLFPRIKCSTTSITYPVYELLTSPNANITKGFSFYAFSFFIFILFKSNFTYIFNKTCPFVI
jgi:hypothetical protein